MSEHSGTGTSAGESSGRGERRKALERERRIFLETGQIPLPPDPAPTPQRSDPAPNSRRARRLAEQGTRPPGAAGVVPGPQPEGQPVTGSPATGQVAAAPTASTAPATDATAVTRATPPGPSATRSASGRQAPGTANAPVWEGDRRGVGVLEREVAPEPVSRAGTRGTEQVVAPPTIRPPRRSPEPDVLPQDPAPGSSPPSWQDTLRTVADPRPRRDREDTTSDQAAARHHTPQPAMAPPRRWRRGVLAVLAVLLVAALVVGVVWYLRSAGTGGSSASPPVVTPQGTVLVVLDDGAGGLAASSILAVDDAGAVSVLIPGSLLVDVPGAGRRPLSGAVSASPTAPAEALSDALQVRIDGTWRLSLTGLAQLVDAAGGIVVDVDTALDVDGVSVQAGAGQRLTGDQAAVVASALADGELEERRLARFQSVLVAVLAGLPDGEQLIEERLAALGTDSSYAPADFDAAPALARLRRGAAAGEGIPGTVLPVRTVTAGDTSVYGLDQEGATAMVDRLLPGAKLPVPPGGNVRVLVQNGVGIPGLAEAARERLVGAGLRYVAGCNAVEFGRERTAVLVPSDSGEDRARGVRVAVALGVPAESVAIDVLGSNLAEVVVVLGQDFADDVTDRGVDPTAEASAATDEGGAGASSAPTPSGSDSTGPSSADTATP